MSPTPVLCVVIVSGIVEAFEVEMGIDMDAPVIGSPTDRITLKTTGVKASYSQQAQSVTSTTNSSQHLSDGHHLELETPKYL